MLDQARFAPVALPLIAALLTGCQRTAETNNVAVAVAAPPQRAATPAELAQRLVSRQLGGGPLDFADARVFTSQGATIVCGRVARAAQPAQRYIAVGEDDLFIESQMQPGHMDRAVTEFCRNA